MEPAPDEAHERPDTADDTAPGAMSAAVAAADAWQPGIPDLKEHLPSIVWGAAFPIGVYFLVRRHVNSDAQALIVAGGCSVVWIVFQFVRRRRVDLVGVIVLFGFVVGVASSILLHGNAYVLKVRDAFFTALFGAACVVTVFTHERPTLFYVSRYLSTGNDPDKVAAYNLLHEVPIGRRTFKVLSIVWGIGLMAEAGFRMVLAEMLPTGTFLAVSPFITTSIIGSLFAFTVVYSKRAQLESAALTELAAETVSEQVPGAAAEVADGGTSSQIPLA
jgi:hypothetical protein